MADDWQQHWFDLPEFEQENRGAIKQVTISFETEADIEAFNQATGLKITLNTKGAFFPMIEPEKVEYR